MNWLLTIVLCAVLVEIVLRLPFRAPLLAVLRSSNRAIHVVSAKTVSDHWKEKAMGAYARKTFAASAKIAGLLAVALGAATLLVLAFDFFSDGYQTFVVSWNGLGVSVVAVSIYFAARKAIVGG